MNMVCVGNEYQCRAVALAAKTQPAVAGAGASNPFGNDDEPPRSSAGPAGAGNKPPPPPASKAPSAVPSSKAVFVTALFDHEVMCAI